jgi:hypothetical protein
MSNVTGNRDALNYSKQLLDEGQPDEAWKVCLDELEKSPNDPVALLVASHIMEQSNNVPTAYQFAKLCTQLAPDKDAGWINLGRCADQLWLMDEAQYCYWKAYDLTKSNERRALILNNLAAVKTQLGKFKDAESFSRKSLEFRPGNEKADHNLGICLLARGAWQEGWQHYSASLGGPTRRWFRYDKEALYDGTKGASVAIHGEQGLGDEIMYASMIPELIRDSKKVILDCDKRLEGLFRRSFTNAKVYGTRTQRVLNWAEEDRVFEFSTSAAEIGKYYRNDDAQFPGTPYLKPDPDRVLQWRALFNTYQYPVIGLAWTGGVKHTGQHFRSARLEDFLPLMKLLPNATWVSLQYKDPTEELDAFADKHDIEVLHFPRATLTKDYDDTAGLVAALDRVICVPTTVAHLAGSMGIACDVIANSEVAWPFHRDKMPWYNSLRVFRKGEKETWSQAIGRYANENPGIQMGAHGKGNHATEVAAA